MKLQILKKLCSRDGYVTLIASVIITVGILIVAVTISNIAFLGRFDTLGVQFKDIAREVAKGCLEYARLKLSINLGYEGNETHSIGSYSCQILPIETPGANQKVIKSRAVVNTRVANLKLTVSTPAISIISLEELNTF